ncbi:MAG: hypothetical protein AB8F95_13700 [Bacteroidia bacterium]
MSFEEYVELQSRFVEVTPEVLERLKVAYKNTILAEEDANYLEPLVRFEENFPSGDYPQLLRDIFAPFEIDEGELTILILPSFEPEFQFKFFKNGEVEKQIIDRQLWTQLSLNEEIDKACHNQSLILNSEKRLTFLEQVKAHTNKARAPQRGAYMLDGTQYYFISKHVGEVQIVYKNASEEDETEIGALLKSLYSLTNQ